MASNTRGVFSRKVKKAKAKAEPEPEKVSDEVDALLAYYAAHPALGFAHLHHVTEHGKKIDLAGRPYLLPFYEKAHEELDRISMKSVQVGITEELISEVLYWAEEGLSVLYVLPTRDIRGDFVKNRIDKTARLSSHHSGQFRFSVGGSDAVGLKHYGRGTLKFVGSNTPNEFLEYPADVLVIDENDRCNAENVAMAEDRISASAHKIRRVVGNPTGEQVGISKLFWEESTAAFWTIPCSECRFRQHIDWFANVVEETEEDVFILRDREWQPGSFTDIRPICISCQRPFDRLALGEYVATYPSRSRVGRHLDKLFIPTNTLAELWEKFLLALLDPVKRQVFHNNYLGYGYTPKGARPDDTLLNAARREYHLPSSGKKCTMGVDVGNRFLHVRISDHPAPGVRRMVYSGTIPMSDGMTNLDPLMVQYGVDCAAVDWQPETSAAKAFRKRWPGRVYLVRYPTGEKITEIKKDAEDPLLLIVDRTQSLDDTMQDLVRGFNWLPAEAAGLDGGAYYMQMKSSVRVYDHIHGVARWENTGPDHYRHADNYDKVAYRMLYNMSYGDALIAAQTPLLVTPVKLPLQAQVILDLLREDSPEQVREILSGEAPSQESDPDCLWDLPNGARTSYRHRLWTLGRLPHSKFR